MLNVSGIDLRNFHRTRRDKKQTGEAKGCRSEGKEWRGEAAKDAQQLSSQPAQVLGSGSGVEEHGDPFAVWVRGGSCRPARSTNEGQTQSGDVERRWRVVEER